MQFSILSAGLVLLAPLASAASDLGPTQAAKESPKLGVPTSQGCFKSSKGLKDANIKETQASSGMCREACQALSKPVFALSEGTTCYCGDSYPPKADLTDDSACDTACLAYPLEACGNLDGTAFSVWNTGDKISVPFNDGGDDDDSSSTASGSKTATSTSGSGSKTAVSTSVITGAVESATGLATAASEGTETPSSTESAAVATSSIPSSGSKSLMGAGVAILVAALAV
ncbi:unnamed protein product [Clonostachys solani]|uniref:WSC domain-containing protein n=1 Tax=Clonostachys solani TaxID=160281 RepID=A0A9N9YZ37_9HYPO|nr:unnamed protein product [Clonostachys solani]